MIQVGDRIDQPDLLDAVIRHAGIIHVDGGHLAQDFLGRGIIPFCRLRSGPSKPRFEARRQVAEDLPVGAGHAAGRVSSPHTLDTAVGVGKGPILFGERRGRQEDIRERARLVDEQILCDEELEMRHVLTRLVEVWLGHHGILAHDVQRPDSSLMRVAEDFRGRQTQLAREPTRLDVPGLLPFDGVLFIVHAHVARIVKRHRAHVARSLHVVLPAQGIQSRAVAPDVTREEGQMYERERAGSAV